jgi:DNA-binding NarL/FixJ family response regulator
MERESGSATRLALIGVLALLAINAGVNVLLDVAGVWPGLHLALEILTAVVGMVAATVLWIAWRRAERGEAEARAALSARKAERDQWRESAQRALEGLGAALDAQFRVWDLTPTEREVALLLLKGYSHKRIAEMTGRRERTVRQHGVVVYQKSGLAGRAELAAYFLEDLMLPNEERDALKAGGSR